MFSKRWSPSIYTKSGCSPASAIRFKSFDRFRPQRNNLIAVVPALREECLVQPRKKRGRFRGRPDAALACQGSMVTMAALVDKFARYRVDRPTEGPTSTISLADSRHVPTRIACVPEASDSCFGNGGISGFTDGQACCRANSVNAGSSSPTFAWAGSGRGPKFNVNVSNRSRSMPASSQP